MNEFLIILTLAFTFGLTLLWFYKFREYGLYGLTVFLTIVANIEVMVVVDAFGIEMTLGNMLFAGTFLATDMLSEMYDKHSASRCVKVGILTSLCMIVITSIWMKYTPAASDTMYPAMRQLFANTPRVMISSLVVYAACQVLDVQLYHWVWKMTGYSEKHMWIRNNVATLMSQFANAVMFNFLAFYGTMPIDTLVSVIVANFLITIVTSMLDTPVLYAARALAKKKHYGKY